MSDLVLMDNTYSEMIGLRRKLIVEETGEVVGFNPVAREAVHELFLWMFGTYLPRRYPSMFRVIDKLQTVKRRASPLAVRNLVLDETIMLDPLPEPVECLKILGCHVDCEFAISLPIASPRGEFSKIEPTDCPKVPYHLHAFILAFPSDFTPAEKLGLPLAGMLIMTLSEQC